MSPNASILLLLTIENNDNEEIVLLYLRELQEVAPPNLFWYPRKGSKAECEYIWQEKNLKQWLVIGEDSEIRKIADGLITEKKANITISSKKISFKIGAAKLSIYEEESIEKIKDIEPLENIIKYKFENFSTDISFLINHKDNCSYVDGYGKNENIKPIYPSGFLPENFLFEHTSKFILAVLEKRNYYSYLRGDGDKDKKANPKRLMGFIQADKDVKENLLIEIHEIDNGKILGESSVDVSNGTWNVSLKEPAGKGSVLLRNKNDQEIAYGFNYYLIKDIHVNMHVVSRTIIDLFGRNHNIVSDNELEKPLEMPLLWHRDNASDEKRAEIELSDRYTKILLSLGDCVYISDPYLLGEIILENEKVILNKDQFIFLNGLIMAVFRGQLKSLKLICNWRHVKKYCSGNKELAIKNYKHLFTDINSNLGKANKKLSVDIIFCKSPFHDRHWFGKNNDTDIVYHVSNSINGVFENGEVSFSPLFENENYQMRMKLERRLNNSEKESL